MTILKQLLALISKLPNVHTVHDRITAIYNAWLSIYALLHKLGLVAGGQLTPDQAQQVLNAEFAAAARDRAAQAAPPAQAPVASAPVAEPTPLPEGDTEFVSEPQ